MTTVEQLQAMTKEVTALHDTVASLRADIAAVDAVLTAEGVPDGKGFGTLAQRLNGLIAGWRSSAERTRGEIEDARGEIERATAQKNALLALVEHDALCPLCVAGKSGVCVERGRLLLASLALGSGAQSAETVADIDAEFRAAIADGDPRALKRKKGK